MRKKHPLFLSLGYFIIGIFLLFNSKINITGAVIGSSYVFSAISFILGLVFVLGGMIIFVAREEGLEGKIQNGRQGGFNSKEIKKSINKILKLYTKKEIDETEFASKINEEIEEITGMLYNPGTKQLTIRFRGVPPNFIGYPIKIEDQGTNKYLGIALYRRIMNNSPRYECMCQVHFSREEASKHHAKGLKKYLD